jgi:hypothetical protein
LLAISVTTFLNPSLPTSIKFDPPTVPPAKRRPP